MEKGSSIAMAASKILILLVVIPGAMTFSYAPMIPGCINRGTGAQTRAAGYFSHPMRLHFLVRTRSSLHGIRGTRRASNCMTYLQSSSSPSDGMSWIDVNTDDAEDYEGSSPPPSLHCTLGLIELFLSLGKHPPFQQLNGYFS